MKFWQMIDYLGIRNNEANLSDQDIEFKMAAQIFKNISEMLKKEDFQTRKNDIYYDKSMCIF